MRGNRRLRKIFVGEGIWFAVAALLFVTVVVPIVTKYPKNLKATTHYAGTFTLYTDPATNAPLATPVQVPLTVDRRVATVPSKTGANRVVVDEVITQHAGDIVNTTQHNVYVMDRKTAANVNDPRAYAFVPSNKVNRAGSYRLNLRFDLKSSARVAVYENELGTTYQLQPDKAQPTVTTSGLKLNRYTAAGTEVPLAPGYVTELGQSVRLPLSLTFVELAPQLKAQGIDVDALLTALTPKLSAEDQATLGAMAFKPIKLQYVATFNGSVAAEPMTGAEVDVSANETIGVRPAMTDLPVLQTILRHYPTVPEAIAADAALTKVAAGPATKLFGYSYQQTPASVAEVAKQVKDMRSQLRMAKVFIPATLAILSLIGFILTGVTYRRRPQVAPVVDLRTIPIVSEPTPQRQAAGGER